MKLLERPAQDFEPGIVAAEIVGIPWDKVEITWGNTAKNLPWTCISGGSQTTHAMTRASYAAGMDAKRKLQEIAAKTLGGKPENYTVSDERVSSGGRSLTLAQAAQKAIEEAARTLGLEIPTAWQKVLHISDGCRIEPCPLAEGHACLITPIEKLTAYMNMHKPYLDGNLTLHSLSSKVGLAPNHLSQIVNERSFRVVLQRGRCRSNILIAQY